MYAHRYCISKRIVFMQKFLKNEYGLYLSTPYLGLGLMEDGSSEIAADSWLTIVLGIYSMIFVTFFFL